MSLTKEEQELFEKLQAKKEKVITAEQLTEVRDAMDKAQESGRPYPIINNDELTVVGDTDKIELNEGDYYIKFSFPVSQKENVEKFGDIIREDKKTIVVGKEYKKVTIPPKTASKLQAKIGLVLPYVRKIEANGKVTSYSDEEIIEIAQIFNNEVIDGLYEIVSVALGISKSLIEWVTFGEILVTFFKLVDQAPRGI